MASSLFRLSSRRSGRLLLGLLAPIICLPAGQALAVDFERDPSLNGWNRIGNSTAQGTPTFGGWASGGGAGSPYSGTLPTASFDVYSSRFTLGASDTVKNAAPGTTSKGDSYLVGTNNQWQEGDNIVAFGIKWLNGVKGYMTNGASQNSLNVFNFDPTGNAGWTYGTLTSQTPGASNSFTNNSADGDFAVNVFTGTGATNNSSYYSYRVNPSSTINPPTGCGTAGSIYYVYGGGCFQSDGNIAGNNTATLNPATVGTAATGTLPVRSFYNDNGGGFDYYTMFINQSLQGRNGKGEAVFEADAKWLVTLQTQGTGTNFNTGSVQVQAANYGGGFDINTHPAPPAPSAPTPGPLPLLGAGAALGWSRKLRRKIKPCSAVAAKTRI